MKVLTVADGDALAAYCTTYARWQQAEEFIAKHGVAYPIRDDKGQIRFMQPFPQVAIARSLLQLVKTYQQEFGLTPSARTRIEVAEKPGGGLAAFIAEARAARADVERSDAVAGR